jgi:hypothetical protein
MSDNTAQGPATTVLAKVATLEIATDGCLNISDQYIASGAIGGKVGPSPGTLMLICVDV